jgi:hypothetical protein
VDADLEVRTIHRDASMYEAIAEDTWVLCFGWYMHALFSMRHGFPLHRNVRPIFVSFHCNKRALLTPEAVEYLRRYGPVGCRDWSTVYLLRSLGVPAFFSGCVTTTIDTVFGDLPAGPPAGAPVAYVDVPDDEVPPGGVTYRHSSDAVRRRPFTANVREALDLLDRYRTRHRGVVTSRLHCYLPLRSIGVDVEFTPKNPSDVRFDGLLGISDEEFGAMREGLLAKLEQVMTAVLSGRPEEEVYALWRDITAEDVAEAERRSLAGVDPAPAPSGVPAPLDAAAPVDCAVILPPGEEGGRSLAVLHASLLEHASRPVRLWVLAPPGAERPELPVSWVATGGEPVRVALPDLLPDVSRLVLLPLPSVVEGDVAELAGLDLEGHALAAPTRPGTADTSGFGIVHGAASRLRERTGAAAELRRTAHARHAFDFDAFTDDVLVLDLDRMRREGFRERALELMREYELTELEVLHLLVGAERAEVPPRWATVPTRAPVREPALVHWADRVKPWQPELTPERDRWRRYPEGRSAPPRSRPAGPGSSSTS